MVSYVRKIDQFFFDPEGPYAGPWHQVEYDRVGVVWERAVELLGPPLTPEALAWPSAGRLVRYERATSVEEVAAAAFGAAENPTNETRSSA